MNTTRQPNWFFHLLLLMLACGSITLVEPAPYDLLFPLLFALSIYYSYTTFNTSIIFPLILLLLFVESNLFSFFAVKDPARYVSYTLITFYMIASWLCFAGIASRFKGPVIETIFKGYVFSAVLSALMGIAAYYDILPFSDLFLMDGRVKGLFKDPNVYGPFLIPPAIYLLFKIENCQTSRIRTLFLIAGFALLSVGVLLSFSRAAWGHFVLTLLVYFLFYKSKPKKRLRLLAFLLLFSVPTLLYFVTSPDVAGLFQERFGYQKYDDTRFSKQLEALQIALEHPLGIGAGQSEEIFDHATHSLYVRIFSENGIIGALSFFLFFLSALLQSLRNMKRHKGIERGLFAVILASLIGIAFNSFFIDTIHWRHF